MQQRPSFGHQLLQDVCAWVSNDRVAGAGVRSQAYLDVLQASVHAAHNGSGIWVAEASCRTGNTAWHTAVETHCSVFARTNLAD